MMRSMTRLPDDKFADIPDIGTKMDARSAMQVCFEVAKRGLGKVSPNPLVGCVVLDGENRLQSLGWHNKIGEAHAERMALKDLIGEVNLENSSLYVSLEPCSHHGRTPPCVDIVLESGIKKLFYAIKDPNPHVSGKGIQKLSDHGVHCEELPGFREWAWEQNGLFFARHMKSKNISVGMKAGMTLDGKIAMPGDQRKMITCERSLAWSHFLRLDYDAILIGRKTLELDNPSLTPRDTLYGDRIPFRVVLDGKGEGFEKLASTSIRLLNQNPEKVVWILDVAHKEQGEKIATTGAKVLYVASTEGRLHPQAILDALVTLGIHSVLVEGGAEVYRSFLETDLVDRLQLVTAPKVYGPDGVSFYQGSGTEVSAHLSLLYTSDVDHIIDMHLG